MWSATRWQTYNLMCCSMADLKSAGIYKPTDLITFPWEEEEETAESATLDDKEIAQLRQKMRDYNAKVEAERKAKENNESTQ